MAGDYRCSTLREGERPSIHGGASGRFAIMQDITIATTTDLATAICAHRISSTEALEAHLAQIARHNPSLNAVVTLDEEGARRRAREADEALARGEVWGPLHGVPMTLKDG